MALIETKDYKNKVISLLSGSRSLYYGLFYYYSFLGETSNLNLENIFEIIDSYFLKKYHDNFHSQYLKDLSSKLSLAVSEKSFSMNYFIQIIINLLESSYHIMLENPNNKYTF